MKLIAILIFLFVLFYLGFKNESSKDNNNIEDNLKNYELKNNEK